MKPLFNRAAFSRRVREAMAEDGLSLRQAAEQSGVHYNTVHRVVKGRQAPTLESYLRLERWLNKRADELPSPVFSGLRVGVAPFKREDWSHAEPGTVLSSGSIKGREPGIAYSAGTVYIKQSEIPAALERGWKLISRMGNGLAMVERA